MSELTPDVEAALLAILKQQNNALNERQACLDIAAALERVASRTAVPSAQTAIRLAGSHRPQEQLYILAYTMGECYWAHTGKGPGMAGNVERKTVGGRYPRFIKILADAMGLTDRKTGKPYTLKKVASACKRARDALNGQAALAAMPAIERDDPNDIRFGLDKKHANRETERLKILAPHVAGYADPEGNLVENPVFERGEILKSEEGTQFVVVNGPEPIIEGYEPAPDRERRPASEVSKDALAGLLKE